MTDTPQPEPWRTHVTEVAETILACRDELNKAGINPTVGELIEMARLALSREFGWPRRERAPF
jgi:hypothetical protein